MLNSTHFLEYHYLMTPIIIIRKDIAIGMESEIWYSIGVSSHEFLFVNWYFNYIYSNLYFVYWKEDCGLCNDCFSEMWNGSDYIRMDRKTIIVILFCTLLSTYFLTIYIIYPNLFSICCNLYYNTSFLKL